MKVNKRLPKFHNENDRQAKKYISKMDLGDQAELKSYKEKTEKKIRKENKNIKEEE